MRAYEKSPRLVGRRAGNGTHRRVSICPYYSTLPIAGQGEPVQVWRRRRDPGPEIFAELEQRLAVARGAQLIHLAKLLQECLEAVEATRGAAG